MLIFPAIDLVGGQAVRLYRGDYKQMTVYDPAPENTARAFRDMGMDCVHIVDLEGARDGGTPNFDAVCRIKWESGLFCEIGGGIRTLNTVEKYLSAGLDRVILGTAAFTDKAFLRACLSKYADRVAVGLDIRDGKPAVKGWLETVDTDAFDFAAELCGMGVKTIICTDISRDGAMRGANRELYRRLSDALRVNITASGGVSTLEDVKALRLLGLYGAIIGKAYYEGTVDLKEAKEAAR